MDLAAIKTAIFGWVNSVTNPSSPTTIVARVVWADQAAPRPPNPSISLKIVVPPTAVGMDELRDVANDDDDFEIVGQRPFTLSVNAYGDAAAQLISNLQTSVYNPSAMAGLAAAGVSVLSTGAPRDLSELLETKVEQRFQVDAFMLAFESLVVQPGVIETVEASGDVGGRDLEFDTE